MRKLLASLIASFFCALPAAGQDSAGEKAVQEYEADFDWLAATNGKDEFRQPLLTLNQEDLKRFVATGTVFEKQVIGKLIIENRQGTYYSNKENPDTSLDVPASVVIVADDKVLVGAKGLHFNTDAIDNNIMIEHWNGSPGCSLSRWFLEITLAPSGSIDDLQVVESEFFHFEKREKCTPG